MKLAEMAQALRLEPVHTEWDDSEVKGGYTSDLLSDVMANAGQGQVFITIQAHKNTVAVATLAGISAIVLASNRPAPDDMTEAAKEERVAIFRSAENQFALSGKLYALLHGGSQ